MDTTTTPVTEINNSSSQAPQPQPNPYLVWLKKPASMRVYAQVLVGFFVCAFAIAGATGGKPPLIGYWNTDFTGVEGWGGKISSRWQAGFGDPVPTASLQVWPPWKMKYTAEKGGYIFRWDYSRQKYVCTGKK